MATTRRTSAKLSRQAKHANANESEKLLKDSDEDVKDNIIRKDTSNESEIILDDSDSDIEELFQVSSSSPKVSLSKPKPKSLVKITPQAVSKPQPQSQSSKTSSLDENKIKSILNNVASRSTKSNNLPAARSPKLNPRLNISLSDQRSVGGKAESKSQPGTPKIVLHKVGSKWQNSSTPLTSKSKLKSGQKKSDKNHGSQSDSNSDEDFVPNKGKLFKTRKAKKSEDSDSDSGELNETIPLLSRSTRSTRSSVNTSKSDISRDVSLDESEEFNDEIQEELAKLEALQNILAQTKPKPPVSKDTSKNMSKHKKSKVTAKGSLKASKPSISDLPKVTPKVVAAPKLIERGQIDCFDDLIVETTAGFPCNFCDSKEMFKKRKEMIHHLQTQHEEELNDEQKNSDLSGFFSCEICNTTFYSKFILRTHKKAHMKSTRAGCDKYYQYYLKFGKV